MYNLKIIKSGRRVEVYSYRGYTVNNKGEEITGKVFKEPKEEKEVKEETETKKEITEERRLKTLNAARNNIIRLISANEDMKVFITLTFKEESNYKDSKKLLNTFFTKLRRDFKALKYLWCIEFGSLNGRLHYHVLCNIEVKIKTSKSNEFKSLEHKDLENQFRQKYWKYGFVDIRNLEQEGNNGIAKYIAAYLTKDMIDKQFEGYRIYGYSHKTMEKPDVIKEYTTESLESLIERYSKNYNIKYSNSYTIGYTTPTGDYRGVVSYFDLIQKGD